MNNSIPTTKFFNTGFLSQSLIGEMRIKQGLMPQTISNDCLNSYSKEGYVLSKNLLNTRYNPPISNNRMYPALETPLPTYGLRPIPSNAPCARYVQPP